MVQVKKNQLSLFRGMVQAERDTPCTDRHTVEEKKNGVRSTWKVQVHPYSNPAWESIRAMVVVCKTVTGGGKKPISTYYKQYYASDEQGVAAEQFAIGIRGHWGIENNAHKPKDMLFNQDKNKVKELNAAVNRAIMNTVALNYLTVNFEETTAYAQIIFAQTFKNDMYKNRN